MRPVNLRPVVSRRIPAATILGILLIAASAQGVASAQTREIAVRTLGGPNRFSGPMHSVDDLRTMVTTNQSQITSALQQAGLGDISTAWLNTVNTGYVGDTTVAPGTHFDWMALKRAGRPGVLHNVRWTGAQSFDAFQFSVEAYGYSYTFIVPKICGNFALVRRTAVVAAAPPPAPAPEPPPPLPPVRKPVQAPPPPPTPAPGAATTEREYPWMVAGYLGTSFTTGGLQQALLSTSSADGGLTYGMQAAYVKKYVGAEFIGEFAPNFKLASLALADEPSVNSWMFNVIGSAPFGTEQQFAAYASGGLGGITMRTSTFTLAGTETLFVGPSTTRVALNTINNTQTKFAYNIGGGFLAYVSQWGIRADLRYYQATTADQNKLENGPTVGADFTQSLLSGLTYWRANLGISYRF